MAFGTNGNPNGSGLEHKLLSCTNDVCVSMTFTSY